MDPTSAVRLGESLQETSDAFFGFLPNLLGAALLALASYVLARLARTAVARLLEREDFDRALYTGRAGVYVDRVLEGASPAELAAAAAYWSVLVAGFAFALSTLGIPAVTELFAGIAGFLPRALAAALILTAAAVVALALRALAESILEETPTGRVLGAVGPALVMGLAVFMALDQLGIARDIVSITYAALLGGLGLGMALAFGLGGRRVAAGILEEAYRRGQEGVGQLRADADRVREEAASEGGPDEADGERGQSEGEPGEAEGGEPGDAEGEGGQSEGGRTVESEAILDAGTGGAPSVPTGGVTEEEPGEGERGTPGPDRESPTAAGRRLRRNPPSDDRGRVAAQVYCLAVGVALVLMGLLGFFADATFDTGREPSGAPLQGHGFLGFEVNGWHNLFHLASGAALLVVAGRRNRARVGAVSFGAAYGVIAVIGLVDGNDVLGLIPVNPADNVLHPALAGLALYAGLKSPTSRRERREVQRQRYAAQRERWAAERERYAVERERYAYERSLVSRRRAEVRRAPQEAPPSAGREDPEAGRTVETPRVPRAPADPGEGPHVPRGPGGTRPLG